MPSLQLDVPAIADVETMRALSKRLGATYADVMETRPDIITVANRDLGEGGVWRCSGGEPDPSSLLMCDVRRGRDPRRAEPPAHRRLRRDPRPGRGPREVEFTQHAGDEMYHPQLGGFNRDWEGDES